MEEPTGIWVILVPIWPVAGEVFIIVGIVLLIVFCLWDLLGRVSRKLKAKLEDSPLIDVLALCAILAGV